MRRTLMTLGVLLLASALAWGQGQIGPNDACRSLRVNPSGVAGADITVDTTAVTVMAADQGRCGALILNASTSNTIRCRSITDGDPTATVGTILYPGRVLAMEIESQRGVRCTRDSTATGSATVNVTELWP